MAYKDKDKAREASRERIRRYRDKAKGVTTEGVTSEGVTYHNDREELTARGLLWRDLVDGDNIRRPWFVDGIGWTIATAPRYLTLSDGQVMDRYSLPYPNRYGDVAMARCNSAAGHSLARDVSPALRHHLKKVVA